MKKIIFYNILVFSFLYSFIEILSGTLIFNKIDCHYLLCDKSFTYKNNFGFYKNGSNQYNKNEFGFRGMRKKISEIDFLTVGGSTTDERYLNLKDTWSEKLESIFIKNNYDLDVVNAGIDGQSTIGHIWNFENWFPKIKDFSPKYIIFYLGINERLFESEISRYDNNFDNSNMNLIDKIIIILKKNNGITYKLYNLINEKYFVEDKINVGHKIRNSNYILAKNKKIINRKQKEKLYKNLELLVSYTRDLGSVPIFVNQKTLRGIKIDGENYAQDEFDILFHEKQIADIIKNFSLENDIIFINLFDELQFDNKDLYDLVHATPKGSEKIANFLFKKLKSKIILN